MLRGFGMARGGGRIWNCAEWDLASHAVNSAGTGREGEGNTRRGNWDTRGNFY